MFGLDSFASHAFASNDVRGIHVPIDVNQEATLDATTITQNHVITPNDLLSSVMLNAIGGFESNEFTSPFDILLVASRAKREFLITISPFKLRPENPTST